jgi:inner membrane protein
VPSAFAHALVGASLAAAVSPRSRPVWLPLALAALAVAPDLDVLGLRLGIAYEHPLGHRGFSHSLATAALTGALSALVWRRVAPDGWRAFAVLTFVAVASHGILDAFTDAGLGIGLLLPLDDTRYFAPWRPILTSPLSVAAFLSPRGLAVLANEAAWLGIPAAAFVLVMRAARRAPRGSRPFRA